MGFLGVTLVIIGGLSLLFVLTSIACMGMDKGELIGLVIAVVVSVAGIFMINYDLKSPLEITQEIIQTTDTALYGIVIHNPDKKSVNVLKITTDAIRYGAVLNDLTEYKLVIGE